MLVNIVVFSKGDVSLTLFM